MRSLTSALLMRQLPTVSPPTKTPRRPTLGQDGCGEVNRGTAKARSSKRGCAPSVNTSFLASGPNPTCPVPQERQAVCQFRVANRSAAANRCRTTGCLGETARRLGGGPPHGIPQSGEARRATNRELPAAPSITVWLCTLVKAPRCGDGWGPVPTSQ